MKASEINIAEAYGASQHSQHRGPRAAGSADRYYGRSYQPNFAYNGYTFHEGEMTREQLAEYAEGWKNEMDTKDWGEDFYRDDSEEAEA